MSPNTVNNFTSELIEMAKAVEQLPQVQAQLAEERAALSSAMDTIQNLQLRIIDYKTEVDGLQSKLRTVEAERDDAQFRFLEAEERASGALGYINAMLYNLDDAKAAIEAILPKPTLTFEPEPEGKILTGTTVRITHTEPPVQVQPEPEPTPTTEPSVSQGQSAVNPPAVSSQDGDPSQPQPASSNTVDVTTDAGSAAQGQSEPLPTPTATAQATTDTTPSAEPATPPASAEAQPFDSDKPYVGKTWSEVRANPDIVTPYKLSDWLAGGGTEEGWAA